MSGPWDALKPLAARMPGIVREHEILRVVALIHGKDTPSATIMFAIEDPSGVPCAGDPPSEPSPAPAETGRKSKWPM